MSSLNGDFRPQTDRQTSIAVIDFLETFLHFSLIKETYVSHQSYTMWKQPGTQIK